MAVTVKLFASLRERLGNAELRLDLARGGDVATVWRMVSGEPALPANVRCAVNLEYVDASHPVRDGDEVGFFPPVTGG
ncbi:MAG: MoaD/ThiS family protein [Ectothiorhodospiraceae bacterium]|nr:MoaD/ThiS family protein [Chromatiales bacterium]MCP5156908.1 MoaD/ThiS family protein [Ectothiorhodospiraceae bacterium]